MNQHTSGQQHPEEWRADLNPDHMRTEQTTTMRTAYDVKDLHRRLRAWEDDDLKQIPVIPDGMPLEQGATYIDLALEQPREFQVWGDVIAGRDHCYVAKDRVDYTLWNRLIGVDNPARTAANR